MSKDRNVPLGLGLLGGNAKVYNTIAEMQKDSKLKTGKVVEVLGYYQANDGATHLRVIAQKDDGSGVLLENGLYANIVHNGEVNVSWFGAKGDGVTDDSWVIQKAIDYYNVVSFNDLTYLITNINLNNNSYLKLNKAVLKNNANTMIITANGKTNIKIENGSITNTFDYGAVLFENVDGLEVVGTKFNGLGKTNLAGTGVIICGIGVYKCQNFKLLKLECSDFKFDGINISGDNETTTISDIKTNGIVKDCKFKDMAISAVGTLRGANNILIEGNIVENFDRDGVGYAGITINSAYCSVINNIVYNTQKGVEAEVGIRIGHEPSVVTNSHVDYGIVQGNTVYNVSTGIKVGGSNNVVISNNVVNNTRIGILARVSTNTNISSNVIKDCSLSGIFIASVDMMNIINNIVDGANYAIDLSIFSALDTGVTQTLIKGNNLTNYGARGIQIAKNIIVECVIDGNKFNSDKCASHILPSKPFSTNDGKKIKITNNIFKEGVSAIAGITNADESDTLEVWGNLSETGEEWYPSRFIDKARGTGGTRNIKTIYRWSEIIKDDTNISVMAITTNPSKPSFTFTISDLNITYNFNEGNTTDVVLLLNKNSKSTSASLDIQKFNDEYYLNLMELEGGTVKEDYLNYSLEKMKYDKQVQAEEQAKQEAYENELIYNPELTWEEFEAQYSPIMSLEEKLKEPVIPESVQKFMDKYLGREVVNRVSTLVNTDLQKAKENLNSIEKLNNYIDCEEMKSRLVFEDYKTYRNELKIYISNIENDINLLSTIPYPTLSLANYFKEVNIDII